MSKQFLILISAFVLSTISVAQTPKKSGSSETKCACGFRSILQGGLIEGNTGPSWHVQSVNGVYYKSWFAGVGVGIDYYMMRTVPLFIDVRKDLLKKARTPFLYADAGIQFDWLRTKEKIEWVDSDYRRGRYYDIGGGYKITLKNSNAISVSAGYSLKSLREERVAVLNCFQPPCDPARDYYNYNLKRLSFKIGWQFQ